MSIAIEVLRKANRISAVRREVEALQRRKDDRTQEERERRHGTADDSGDCQEVPDNGSPIERRWSSLSDSSGLEHWTHQPGAVRG